MACHEKLRQQVVMVRTRRPMLGQKYSRFPARVRFASEHKPRARVES